MNTLGRLICFLLLISALGCMAKSAAKPGGKPAIPTCTTSTPIQLDTIPAAGQDFVMTNGHSIIRINIGSSPLLTTQLYDKHGAIGMPKALPFINGRTVSPIGDGYLIIGQTADQAHTSTQTVMKIADNGDIAYAMASVNAVDSFYTGSMNTARIVTVKNTLLNITFGMQTLNTADGSLDSPTPLFSTIFPIADYQTMLATADGAIAVANLEYNIPSLTPYAIMFREKKPGEPTSAPIELASVTLDRAGSGWRGYTNSIHRTQQGYAVWFTTIDPQSGTTDQLLTISNGRIAAKYDLPLTPQQISSRSWGYVVFANKEGIAGLTLSLLDNEAKLLSTTTFTENVPTAGSMFIEDSGDGMTTWKEGSSADRTQSLLYASTLHCN